MVQYWWPVLKFSNCRSKVIVKDIPSNVWVQMDRSCHKKYRFQLSNPYLLLQSKLIWLMIKFANWYYYHRHLPSGWTITKGTKGYCRSLEYNKRVKNLTSEWNQKHQQFIPHASRLMLCIWFVVVLVRYHEYFIPTKFHQNPSSGSGEEVENAKFYRPTEQRTVPYDTRFYVSWRVSSLTFILTSQGQI